MRKKDFLQPKSEVIRVRVVLMQDTSPEHGKAYDDDPQHLGGALSRKGWDDENQELLHN